jgi:putative hydrolase of the HAD superfamily
MLKDLGVCFEMEDGGFSGCKGVLLDFGGTLDSDGEHWLDRFYELYAEAQIGLSQQDIKRVFYHADALCCADGQVSAFGLRHLMRHHVALQFEALALHDIEKQNQMVEAFCSKTEYFLKRNCGLLARLKVRYRLGVVSNFYGNVEVLCSEGGLSGSLDVILDSSQIGMTKPDLGIFELAVKRLGTRATETVFVGDSFERDMMPAQKLGMRTIWMKGPNPRLPSDAEPVDVCISALTELEGLLL